jgi:hypothetical protein
MSDAMMNFIFALVIGKSVRGHLKGKNALNNITDNQAWIDFFIEMILDSHKYKFLLQAGSRRQAPKATYM